MKARPDSKRACRQAEKKRTVKDTEPAGFVRECRFCEVIVLPEHIDVHVKGKKHKKLAGCVPTAECWLWVKPPPAQSTGHADRRARAGCSGCSTTP